MLEKITAVDKFRKFAEGVDNRFVFSEEAGGHSLFVLLMEDFIWL